MEQSETEMSQVTIILQAAWAEKFADSLAQLKNAGLSVTSTDEDDGVVEGDIEGDKVSDLKKLECVEALRVSFEWIAEYPPDTPDLAADDDRMRPGD